MPLGGLITAIGGALGTGMDIFGGINAMHQAKWNQAAQVNVFNALNQLLANSTGNIQQYGAALEPFMLSTMGSQIGNGMANQGEVLGKLGGTYNDILNGAFTNPTDMSRIPGLSDVMSQLGGFAGQAGQGADTVQKLLATIQSNPQMQQALQQASALANGGGGQGMMGDVANEMFTNRGMSNIAGLIQQAAEGPLTKGGYTGPLDYATQYGEALTQPNPFVQQVQNRASDILGGNPLLSMDQVLGLTRNQTATDINDRFQAIKRQLANTTGLTGPAIAGGGENELLSQFGDQALQAQSKAMTDALMGQQNLQLDLFGQGGNLFNSGVQGQLGYSGQGLNSLLQAAAQATGNLGTAGNLGLGSGAQVLQNLLGGAQLQGQANNTTLASLQSILSALGLQGSLTGTSANALSNLLGTGGNLTNAQGSNLFNLQNFGQTQSMNNIGSILNLLNEQGNLSNNMVGQGFSAAQFPGQQLSQWMSLLGQAYQNQVGLFGGNVTPTNYFSNLGSTAGGGNPLAGFSNIGKGGSTFGKYTVEGM